MGTSAFIQIFAGGYQGEVASFAEVRAALDRLPAALELSGVVMGWAPDKTLYQQTRAHLADRGIALYLWLPVFSETSLLKKCDPLIDIKGNTSSRQGGNEAENFDFCCPGSRRNAENVYSIFQENFSDVGFDGVFLDKIRYPSPANPPWGWKACFCPSCAERYRRRGLSLSEIRLAAARLEAAKTPFTILSYAHDKGYHFADATWARFFQAKADAVSASVASLAARFRADGYRVGLDVFAPFLSPFVGQDIIALSRCCDWIKPMMYEGTHAPAGLPFEIRALCREGCPSRHEPWTPAMAEGGHDGLDAAFLRRDLESVIARASCPIYPGLEISRIPKVADITPDSLSRAAGMLPDNTESVVLSWNLLCAPEENVRAAAKLLQ